MKVLSNVFVVVLLALYGFAQPVKAHNFEETPDYAILPGVGIGPIAIGMPAGLALRALARYGEVKVVEVGVDWAMFQAGHVRVLLRQNERGLLVEQVGASGDSRFYVVIPKDTEDDYPHLISSSPEPLVEAWDVACTAKVAEVLGMTAAMNGWEHHGIDLYFVMSPFGALLVGVRVYAAQATTIDRIHELTCGELDQ